MFQGEMRRRVWLLVSRLDALTSFHAGLPSMIRSVDHDTVEPRNLYDWELDEGMSELPPSRPHSEATPVAYLLAKGKILRVLGEIVDLFSSLHSYRYETVLRLDDELSKAYSEVSPHVQTSNGQDSLNDPWTTVTKRLQLEFLFHQGMCVLHRKFLSRGRLDSRFAPSRIRCIESAMALLSQQDTLYRESKIKGIMQIRHWYHVSFSSHDFILAAMILCLDIRHRTEEGVVGDALGLWADETQQTTVLHALRTSCHIWKEAQMHSPEAGKIYRVLSGMLATIDGDKELRSEPLPGLPLASFPELVQVSRDQSNGASLDEETAPFMDIDWVRASHAT